jgi:hypothetical protein
MDEKFKLSAEQIRDVASGHGACFASNRITVEGQQVRFMYREEPDNDLDSGWRFMAGTESDEYINDPQNLSIHDVNTIANYDSDIVPLLGAPVGSAFERSDSGAFVEIDDFEPPRD